MSTVAEMQPCDAPAGKRVCIKGSRGLFTGRGVQHPDLYKPVKDRQTHASDTFNYTQPGTPETHKYTYVWLSRRGWVETYPHVHHFLFCSRKGLFLSTVVTSFSPSSMFRLQAVLIEKVCTEQGFRDKHCTKCIKAFMQTSVRGMQLS